MDEAPESGGVPAWVFLAGGVVIIAGLAVFAVKKSGVRLNVERTT